MTGSDDHATGSDGATDSGDATELDAAVAAFLDDAETVRSEYEQGYMDADAALDVLFDGIEDLEEAYEG